MEITKVRRVLIAVDESQHSQKAFDFYLNEVAYPEDEVVLVHMFTPPAPPALSSKASYKTRVKEEKRHHPFGHDLFLTDPDNDHWTKWRNEVEITMNKLKALLAKYEQSCDEKEISRRAILHSGPPGQGICELAEENKIDLVIIGSRGLSKLRRTLLGSVSEYVLHHTSVAVLVVPASN